MKKFQNTLSECLASFWTNYTDWGRATRAEYWWAVSFYFVIAPIIVLMPIMFFVEAIISPLAAFFVEEVFYLSMATPMFCLTARRLHDTNRSNWNMLWIFVPIVGVIMLIVYLCQQGDQKTNNFGEPRI
ncbi:MAG: DUF805 domain-containing protein [Alphaproteobacteria bacterium]|nr:DUF805 domain-containing protein [Alphaproteobacteria bacterium]